MSKLLITLSDEQRAALDAADIPNISVYVRGLIRQDFKKRKIRFPDDPEQGRYERPRPGDIVAYEDGNWTVVKLTVAGVVIQNREGVVATAAIKDLIIVKRVL
jgi:hypothetical protein